MVRQHMFADFYFKILLCRANISMCWKMTFSSLLFKQDGVMIPFDADTEIKHGLKQVGKKYVFSINGVDPEDSGLYQVEVDGVKVFSTDFKGGI